MIVGSLLEVYTTGWGWKFYGVLWSLFADTGLALYPFMMMVYHNWRSPAENASSVSTSEISSLQSMKWALIFKVIVLILVVVPMVGLDITGEIRYTKSCGGSAGTEVSHGSTGTTLDDAQDPLPSAPDTNIRVPVLPHLVMQIASGVNHALVRNMPCVEGVAELNRQLANVVLDDPELKGEYSRFFSECYVRARNKLNEALEKKSGPLYEHVRNSLDAGNYKPGELLEIDSDFFRDTEGFYLPCSDPATCGHSLQALKPVDGFAPETVSGGRDAAMPASQAALGAGHPYCSEWWENLRPRLVNAGTLQSKITADAALSNNVLDNIAWLVSNFPNLFLSAEEQEKLALRSLIRSNPPDFTGIYEGEESSGSRSIWQSLAGAANYVGLDGVTGFVMGAVGTAGFSVASKVPGVGDVGAAIASQIGGFYASLYIIKLAAPMMQALVLMMIYALLPIYLIISEYKVESAITALVLLFVVKIFTMVFELAKYLEATLFMAMYPDMGQWGSLLTMGTKKLVLDALLMMLYVVGPLLLLYLVTMAGQSINRVGAAGDSGVGTISGIGKGIGGGLGKGAAKATSSFGRR